MSVLIKIIAAVFIVMVLWRCSQNVIKDVDPNPVAKIFNYDIEPDTLSADNIKISRSSKTQIADDVVRTSGFRDAEDIAGEIRFHIVSMKYKFHLRKITPPTDKVTVHVSIDKYGRVSDPQILSPDTLSQNSRDLILSDLKTWQFVQIRQDGETLASFPLNLKNRLQSQ